MASRARRSRPEVPSLPDAELDVLAELRQAGEAAASDLCRALSTRRPLAHGSVLTLLGRLEAKGLVRRRKGDSGKAYVYAPTARAEGAIRRRIDGLLDRVLGGDRMGFVASLLASARPSAGEVDRLEDLVIELRARVRSRPEKRR